MAATNLGFISFKLEDQLEKPIWISINLLLRLPHSVTTKPPITATIKNIWIYFKHPEQKNGRLVSLLYQTWGLQTWGLFNVPGMSELSPLSPVLFKKLTIDTTETARNSAFSKFALNLPLRICNFWFKMFLMVEIQQIQIFQLCMMWYLKV